MDLRKALEECFNATEECGADLVWLLVRAVKVKDSITGLEILFSVHYNTSFTLITTPTLPPNVKSLPILSRV